MHITLGWNNASKRNNALQNIINKTLDLKYLLPAYRIREFGCIVLKRIDIPES